MIPNVLFFLILLSAFKYSKTLHVKELNSNSMAIAFCIKAFVGLIFSYIYIYSKTPEPSDSMRFLDESKLLYNVYFTSKSDFLSLLTSIGENNRMTQQHLSQTFIWNAGNFSLVNDSRNTIRLHALIQFISFGQTFVHTLIMCFISLIGLRELFTAIRPYTQIKPIYLFFAIILLPSTLFWGSGIVKEPLMIFGLGVLIRSLLHNGKPLKRILLGLLGILFLILFKPYVLICILPAVVLYLLNKIIFKYRIYYSILWLLCICIICTFIFPDKRQNITEYISRKQFDMENVGKGGIHIYGENCFYYFKPKQYRNLKIEKDSVQILHATEAIKISFDTRIIPFKTQLKRSNEKNKIHIVMPGTNSHIETEMIDNSFLQLLKNIPEALLNSFFRPFLFDSGSLLTYPSLVEVWFLTFFLILAFVKRREIDAQTKAIIASLLLFALLLLLLIGWTTPINGAIVRFRFPAQLALFIIGTMLIKIKKHE